MKVLINGVTLEEANLRPLLLKIKRWGKRVDVGIVGNKRLKERIKKADIIKNFEFIGIEKSKKIRTRKDLIVEGIRRNFKLWRRIKEFKDYEVIYCISSVLDLLIFPFFLKRVKKDILWVSVFDNVVFLKKEGRGVYGFLAWFFFELELMLLRKADCIFVVDEKLRNYLLGRGFGRKKLVVTGNGVENRLIKKIKRRGRYLYDGVFVGRINESKGINDLLEVLKIVKRDIFDFQLAIVGRGDENTERKYKREIKKSNLEENVRFLGWKEGEEKFEILKSSKVFLFLSKEESFGISLLEAVCSGLFAVAYDLPAYRKIYKNGEVFLFKKGDYQGAAGKVLEIFRKGDFKNRKGEKLLGKYSWDKIADMEYRRFF